MRLYHPLWLLLVLTGAALLLASCAPPQVTQASINVTLITAESTQSVQVPAGSSAQQVYERAGLQLSELDRSEPPQYTVMTDGSTLRLVRVSEVFEIEQVIIPFERQTLRNESLPEGETRLIQAGVNGLQEITYRRVFEDELEVSRSPVKAQIVSEPMPEIVMVGGQSPFATFPIPGRLAYLSGGNAWVVEGNTSNRRPVITTGDLDGRVFTLSPDGEWLLYTRSDEREEVINTLWAARLVEGELLEIDLEAANVVHFAAWVPSSVLRVAYSTVEPRAAAPGWQANNDLIFASFSTSSWVSRPAVVVDANTGGVYGWWGTQFSFSPGGSSLAFSRPDGIGLVDIEQGLLNKVYDIAPLQTFGDWAWVPGLTWSPDGQVLYTVDHVPQQDGGSAETSPLFDMTAVSLVGGAPVRLISQAGMFAYPVPSPARQQPSGENAFQVAYLQALTPTQSKDSRYRVYIADRDGSNSRLIFPSEGAPGIEPQQVVWSPDVLPDTQTDFIALLYKGNLWLVDAASGQDRQLTGDGLVVRLDWK